MITSFNTFMKRPKLIGRRQFLRQGMLAGASLSFGIRQYCRRGSLLIPAVLSDPRMGHLVPQVYSRPLLDSNQLPRFADPLPLMPAAAPVGTQVDPAGNLSPLYQMRMTEFSHQVHSALPATRVWGFNGSVPGPTFQVQSGSAILVDWINSLPTTHMFSVDPTIHGAEKTNPAVRTVVHLHGAKVQPDSDGYPEAWFTPVNRRCISIPTSSRRRRYGTTIMRWASCGSTITRVWPACTSSMIRLSKDWDCPPEVMKSH
jgi:FtsP/CotA-like multicopper oxidase with cupredoxin domain